MATRILTLLLVVLLALPAALVRQPVAASPETGAAPTQSSPADPGQVVAAAKKKDKKKDKKDQPTVTTITQTVRQPLTQTFSNGGVIAIPATGTVGNALPYPSSVVVNGFANGAITDVNLTLNGISHTFPADIDVLLVATQLPGQNAIVMSDAGGATDATNITLTLDDQALTALPEFLPLVSGTFLPTNFETDIFPGQTPSGNSLLSAFNGGNPNGTWQLFVVDDSGPDDGNLASWSLQITADVDVQIQQQVPVPKDKKAKKDKKKGKGKH